VTACRGVLRELRAEIDPRNCADEKRTRKRASERRAD